jgi:DNA modification methylase
MCGDSTGIDAVERLMDGTVPNAVITDPPYGIGIDGQKKSVRANPKHNRKHHEKKGWDAQRPDASIFGYIVALGVPAVVWGGNYFADLLPATRGWLYWGKGQDGLTMSDGELAWTTEDKPLRSKTVNRAALKGSVHPTQKPTEVIEFSVDYLSVPQKGAVLDLFSGSGTICIVCEKTDRRAYMMELDPKYCDVIVKRWQDFTGQDAIYEPTGQTYQEMANVTKAA